MSAPNANGPNEGIVGQVTNSISVRSSLHSTCIDPPNSNFQNAANYVAESVQGAAASASKEGNKEQAKGNVPGKDSLTDRATGALDATSDKLNEKKHDTSASANKQGI